MKTKNVSGVTFDNQRNMYRARRGNLHYGYFTKKSDAVKAVTVAGVTVDRNSNTYRVQVKGISYGHFTRRSDAVKQAIKVS